MNKNAIALTFGYAESTHASILIFQCLDVKDFGSGQNLVDAFCCYLWVKLKLSKRFEDKKCCEKVKTNFCPACGASIKASNKYFTYEGIEDYLLSLHDKDANSYGYEDQEKFLKVNTFSPFEFSFKESVKVLHFNQHAEAIIAWQIIENVRRSFKKDLKLIDQDYYIHDYIVNQYNQTLKEFDEK